MKQVRRGINQLPPLLRKGSQLNRLKGEKLKIMEKIKQQLIIENRRPHPAQVETILSVVLNLQISSF